MAMNFWPTAKDTDDPNAIQARRDIDAQERAERDREAREDDEWIKLRQGER